PIACKSAAGMDLQTACDGPAISAGTQEEVWGTVHAGAEAVGVGENPEWLSATSAVERVHAPRAPFTLQSSGARDDGVLLAAADGGAASRSFDPIDQRP